jgi:hypothetical protein
LSSVSPSQRARQACPEQLDSHRVSWRTRSLELHATNAEVSDFLRSFLLSLHVNPFGTKMKVGTLAALAFILRWLSVSLGRWLQLNVRDRKAACVILMNNELL